MQPKANRKVTLTNYLGRLIAGFYFCFGLVVQHGYAQGSIRLDQITELDGLSQSTVQSIIQDKYGYLWIGTMDGLNRFDGSTFSVYRNNSNDNQSLPNNNVSHLFLDLNQDLWLLTLGALIQYNAQEDNFNTFPIVLPNEEGESILIHDFKQVNDTLVYLATNRGILEFDPQKKRYIRSPVFSFFNKRDLASIISSTGDKKWVVSNNEIFLRDEFTGEWESVFKAESNISTFFDKNFNRILIQTKEKLIGLDIETRALRVVDQFPLDFDLDYNSSGITRLTTGELWVYRKNVRIYDKNDRYNFTLTGDSDNPGSLPNNQILCIYESKDNIVWIGTNAFGVMKYNPDWSVFKYIGNSSVSPVSVSSNTIWDVYCDDDNKIFLGTYTSLDVIDLKSKSRMSYRMRGADGLNTYVNKIFKDPQGTVWLCTRKGLMYFNGHHVAKSGVSILDTADMIIYDFLEIEPGNFLLTTNKGLFRWIPASRVTVQLTDWPSKPIGYFMGQLWLESNNEIRILNKEGTQIIKTLKKNSSDTLSFPLVPIKCFYKDNDGNFWIGSWGGGLSLYHHETGTFTHYKANEGLPNLVVYTIMEDNSGYLWCSTNKGISVFDKKQGKIIRNFDKEDGLQGNEFNTRASFKSKSGQLYFGGINGLTFFNPNEVIKRKVEIPKSIINSVYINQVKVSHFQMGEVGTNRLPLELSWDDRNFGFDISALAFSYPNKVQFRYLLKNYDNSWNYIGKHKRLNFTNIPSGAYTLLISASNSYGEWEPEGLSVGIVVHRPFWKTPWFIGMSIAVFLMFLFAMYYHRIRLLRRQSKYLEDLVNERTRDIHDKKEEIAMQNEELAMQSETLLFQNHELNEIRMSLEEKVNERTLKLTALNHELMEQNNQLEQFAFITAHNIRGPIARIKGLITLLPNKELMELKHLDTSVQQLDDVITDLNTILNVRHGLDRSVQPVSLWGQLSKAIQTMEAEIRKTDTQIDLSEFEDFTVDGNSPYLYSIFYNLIHNAIKYAHPMRKSMISCSCSKVGSKIHLIVKDNGLGIDMRYAQQKIFNLYQRFHPEIKGKGFGLFLVKTQMEAMEGRIHVHSELDKGTTFTLEFLSRKL